MCFLCDKRGEGKVWYLNAKNYGRPIYKKRAPGEAAMEEAITEDAEAMGEGLWDEAMDAKIEGNVEKSKELWAKLNDYYWEYGSYQQVVPLSECYEILELGSPLAAMGCLCRKLTRAREENPETYTCLGIGTGMLKWERWPERYRGGVEFLSPDEAKEWLRKWDDRGMMHAVMLYGGQIGGICNCDYPDCLAIRHRIDYDMNKILLKGHHAASVDYDICNGCGVCMRSCHYQALKYEATTRKANIDQTKCFGCGLCATHCPRNAITLVERAKIPALKEAW